MAPTTADAGSGSAGFEEFHDPRLVALYDAWGVGRDDIAFYLALAEELGASSILDVGCGTGQITCALSERGYAVTGVDPAAPMLDVARGRPGGELVRWIEGDASAYQGEPVDLAIMTAHVAQVIHDDAIWHATLEAVGRAIRPGGHLAFESRNPVVEAGGRGPRRLRTASWRVRSASWRCVSKHSRSNATPRRVTSRGARSTTASKRRANISSRGTRCAFALAPCWSAICATRGSR